MKSKPNKCYIKKCKWAPSIVYLNRELCDYHWEMLCKLDTADMKRKLNLK